VIKRYLVKTSLECCTFQADFLFLHSHNVLCTTDIIHNKETVFASTANERKMVSLRVMPLIKFLTVEDF